MFSLRYELDLWHIKPLTGRYSVSSEYLGAFGINMFVVFVLAGDWSLKEDVRKQTNRQLYHHAHGLDSCLSILASNNSVNKFYI